MKNSLAKYFTWVLSFIFIAAGVLKMMNPENTGDILIFLFEISYESSLWIVYSIAIIEIILGGLFLFDIKKNLIAGLISIFCVAFLLISILGYTNAWEFACGCFGRFSFGRFDLGMVLRNSMLVGMSGWVIYERTKTKEMKPKMG